MSNSFENPGLGSVPYWEDPSFKKSFPEYDKKQEDSSEKMKEWVDSETGIYFCRKESDEKQGKVNINVAVEFGSLYGESLGYFLETMNGFTKTKGEKRNAYHRAWIEPDEAGVIEDRLRNFKKSSTPEGDVRYDQAA